MYSFTLLGTEPQNLLFGIYIHIVHTFIYTKWSFIFSFLKFYRMEIKSWEFLKLWLTLIPGIS